MRRAHQREKALTVRGREETTMTAQRAILNVRAGIGMAFGVGLLASVASADLTNEVFTIHAYVDGQSGMFQVTQDDGTFDEFGNFYWSQQGEIDILSDGGNVLATLSNASVTILADPVINLNFNVLAGNTDTVFSIHSGLLSFPEISDAIGTASAGVTVTDVNGNGASIAPDGSSMYVSHYNGEFPAGTLFAELLPDTLTAGAFQTSHASDEYPDGGGFVDIGDPVVSMSAAWRFTVSAFDMASGTSTFTVIPAPAGLAVLGIAGLAAARRRR
jgi:hypothetical protein